MSVPTLLQVVVLFVAALATGALMVNWIGLARAMMRLSSASAYVEFHQASTRTFDPYMPILVIGAMLGGGVLAALSKGLQTPPGELAVIGALCYAAVLSISLSTNVRLNKLVARWQIHSPPPSWAAIRAKWVRFHILRTLISVPALLSYLFAVVLTCG